MPLDTNTLPEQPKMPPPTLAKSKMVTSTKTVDFPSLGWGIHAGEIRELPVDGVAQKIILEKEFITLIP